MIIMHFFKMADSFLSFAKATVNQTKNLTETIYLIKDNVPKIDEPVC